MQAMPAVRTRFLAWLSRPGVGLAFLSLALLTLLCLVGDAFGQEGEWIDLEALRETEPVPETAVPERAGDPAALEGDASPTSAGDVASEPLADGWMDLPAEALAGGTPERQERGSVKPPASLPRRFHWQGRTRELGLVGYVYLGDYYFVEEHAYDLAEKAYRHALAQWPDCGPILMRLDLLEVLGGDWLLCAEAVQAGLDEGLPPQVRHEYGITPDSPLLSDQRGDVPPVPTMLFLLALEGLPPSSEQPELDAPHAFLRGRLLSYLGAYEEALAALAPVALDDGAEPWHFQAASQRASLHLAVWQPELAYVNLQRARGLAGDHPALLARIEELRGALTLELEGGEGFLTQEVVRILGRRDQGRWALSCPSTAFLGRVEVAHIEGDGLAPGEATPGHLLYRGRDYWLMTLPLGNPRPDWEPGRKVTLLGFASR